MTTKKSTTPATCQWASASRYWMRALLVTVLGGTPIFGAALPSRHVVNQPNLQAPSAKGLRITGQVKDKSGEPLPGVHIRIKGRKTAGAITNPDGKFMLIGLLESDVLTFSMIGFRTQEVPVKGKSEITVVLSEDVSTLNEVVVTGIFNKPKESYTGSVSVVTKEDLQMNKGQNLLQTLRNVDASINIPTNLSVGSNPNRLPNITIRGGSSLPSLDQLNNEYGTQTANTPLIIMDGFEVSIYKLMDFNDEEIESINILKDASATSIYGSRGANGVIVIVTKKPEAGKLKVFGSAGVNLEIPDLSSYNLLNAADKLKLERSIGLYDSQDADTYFALQRYYNERLRQVRAGLDVDWMRKPLQLGIGQRYAVRLDGGSNEFRWSTGVNYNTVNGVMKGSLRNSITADLSLIYQVKNLVFRNSISVGVTNAEESKYGDFKQYVDQQPYNSPYDINGDIVRTFPNFNHSRAVANPLFNTTLNTFNKNDRLSFIDNFSADWLISDAWRLRGQIGVNITKTGVDTFRPAEHTNFVGPTYETPEGLQRKGRYDWRSGLQKSMDGRATLSYTKLLGEKHQLYGGVDVSATINQAFNYAMSGEGYNNQNLSMLSNAHQYVKNTTPVGNETESRRIGFTGNLNYVYDNRFFIDGSYRMDGSSDFGANNKWAPFWSVGIGWNLHHEEWIKKFDLFNNLRLKGSMGEVGWVNFQDNQVVTSYSYRGSKYLTWSAASLSGWGNPNLTWQITRSMSAGLEFGLFRNWLSGEVEVYNKRTNNLLSQMNLPATSGFDSYTENVGVLGNYGLEARLNAYIFRNVEKELYWQVGAQFVWDNSKIIYLSDDVKKQNEVYLRLNGGMDPSRLMMEGYPVNALYAYRSLGINPATGEEVLLNKEGAIVQNITPADKVFIGSGDSPYRGIVNSIFTWKGLTVNLSLGYRFGGLMVNNTLRDKVEVSRGQIGDTNVDARVLSDRWMKPGDHVFFRNFDANSTTPVGSTRFIMPDNTLDIQSLSVQYRWDTDYVKKHLGLRSINFSVNTSNLATFSSVKVERGLYYPFARTVIGSVSLYY